MKLHFVIATIAIGLIVGISCAKKKSPASTATGSLSAACTATSAANTAAALAAIGSVPGAHLALADMNIPGQGVAVSSNTYSLTSPATAIDIDYSQLGKLNLGNQVDASPTFVMWKACLMTDMTCIQKGQYEKSYNFNISTINLPSTGLYQVSLMLCVDDLQYIQSQDQSSAQNQCTQASPCYCGKATTTQYMNGDGFNSAFAKLNNAYNTDQATMTSLANSYRAAAKNYISSCSTKDTGSWQLQYATNIAALSSAEIASYVESYGSDFQQIMASGSQGGLGLAADPNCSTMPTGSNTNLSNTFSNSAIGTTMSYPIIATNTMPMTTSNPTVATNPANPATTVEPFTGTGTSTSTKTASGGMSTGGDIVLGIGIIAMIGGVVALANLGTDIAFKKGTAWERASQRWFKAETDSSLKLEKEMNKALLAVKETQTPENIAKYQIAYKAWDEKSQLMIAEATNEANKETDPAIKAQKLQAVKSGLETTRNATLTAYPLAKGTELVKLNTNPFVPGGTTEGAKITDLKTMTVPPKPVAESLQNDKSRWEIAKSHWKGIAGAFFAISAGGGAAVMGNQMTNKPTSTSVALALAGSGQAPVECGAFSTNIGYWENQLYTQSEKIQTDLSNIAKAQGQ